MLIPSTNKRIQKMIIYNLIFLILFPLIFLRNIYKSIKFREKFSRNLEKLSVFSRNIQKPKKIILIHAVSVGEVLASRKFVEEVQNKFPDHKILMTCSTQTGSETINRVYGDSVLHQYLPFDLRFFIKRFIDFWQPELTFILETEIWPNLIDLLNKKGKKVFLVNGRMSEKSFKRYKSVLPLVKNVFSKFDFIICQGADDLKRFVDLGVNRTKIKEDFSFKFDSIETGHEKSSSIKNTKKDFKVIICASTHDPEEEILVETFYKINTENTILILVPRHPERAQKIYNKLIQTNKNISLFSKDNFSIDFSKKIILVDKIGYLENLFSLADIAFIGGSLIPHGGQNFLEAVKFSLPISSGKSIYNFQQIAEDLMKISILQIGNSPEELSLIWQKQLEWHSEEIKNSSREYLNFRKGASKRALDILPL